MPPEAQYWLYVQPRCTDCGTPFAMPNKDGSPVHTLRLPTGPMKGSLPTKAKAAVAAPAGSSPQGRLGAPSKVVHAGRGRSVTLEDMPT